LREREVIYMVSVTSMVNYAERFVRGFECSAIEVDVPELCVYPNRNARAMRVLGLVRGVVKLSERDVLACLRG
jgi:hypothetical protein